MPNTEKLIAGLNETIEELKSYRMMVMRGYQQAIEELGNEGDRCNKDWSEAYEFLKSRLNHFNQS